MTMQIEQRVGLYGMNLGADAADLAEGFLVLSDGARFGEQGSVMTRNGRVRMGLNFPAEGFGSTVPAESVAHLQAPGRVRGMAAFYDYRIWPFNTSDVASNIPQRLNMLYKSGTQLYFNDDYPNSGTGIITGSFSTFQSPDTRCKILPVGATAYVVDELSPPMVLRQGLKTSQTYLTRIRYGYHRMGVVWPTAGSSDPGNLTQKPTITTSTAGGIPTFGGSPGTYRFRIVLENAWGVRSNPSAYIEQKTTSATTFDTITVKWNTIASTFPSGHAFKVRLYVQFTAENSVATEPTAYLYVNRLDAGSGATGIPFNVVDLRDLANREIMRESCGAPPRMSDLIMVNNVAYGIASSDVVYREIIESEVNSTTVDFRYSHRTPHTIPVRASKLTSKTEIRPVHVDGSYLFWSDPGEPEYMENFQQIGDGSERLVGLSNLGGVCIVFTNQAIYTFNAAPGAEELKKAYSRIGAASRDSIVSTEYGIRFVGTDGIPRIFNGATVDETASELIPLFDRDDYVGDYLRYDKSNPQEIIATQAGRRFYMTFPIADSTSYPLPGKAIDADPRRQLAVGDGSRGRTQWSIDRVKYDALSWLGRENRLLAVDTDGKFYFVEEGLTEATAAPADPPLIFDWKLRKYAAASGMQGQFLKVSIDIDTQGQDVTLECQVDDQPFVIHGFTVNTIRRDEFKTWLPATFKGRFMTIRLLGQADKRVTLHGVAVQSVVRGVF